jgi:hypothetical protein
LQDNQTQNLRHATKAEILLYHANYHGKALDYTRPGLKAALHHLKIQYFLPQSNDLANRRKPLG